MPGNIIHELPDGSALIETFVVGELASVTLHEDEDSALDAACEAMMGRNTLINEAVEIKEQELRAAREAELDEKYPFRHDHPIKIALKGLAFSLTHFGRPV